LRISIRIDAGRPQWPHIGCGLALVAVAREVVHGDLFVGVQQLEQLRVQWRQDAVDFKLANVLTSQNKQTSTNKRKNGQTNKQKKKR
jgi:hypothetical protein